MTAAMVCYSVLLGTHASPDANASQMFSVPLVILQYFCTILLLARPAL